MFKENVENIFRRNTFPMNPLNAFGYGVHMPHAHWCTLALQSHYRSPVAPPCVYVAIYTFFKRISRPYIAYCSIGLVVRARACPINRRRSYPGMRAERHRKCGGIYPSRSCAPLPSPQPAAVTRGHGGQRSDTHNRGAQGRVIDGATARSARKATAAVLQLGTAGSGKRSGRPLPQRSTVQHAIITVSRTTSGRRAHRLSVRGLEYLQCAHVPACVCNVDLY